MPHVSCVRTDFAMPDFGWNEAALAKLKRVTCVAHFAAMWGWGLSWQDAEAVNVRGSMRLYEWALAQGIKGPFLGVCGFKSQIPGSLANLGLQGSDVNWAEKAKRLGAYEVSKICAYQALKVHSSRNKCLPVIWVHPATVIGDTWVEEVPSQSAIVGILQAIRGGRMRLVPGSPAHMVPWVTGRYVAQYVVALLVVEDTIESEHVLLDPASPTLRASVDVMAHAMGKPKALGHIPKSWLAWVLSVPGVARWMGASAESLGFIVDTPPEAAAAVQWGENHGVVHPDVHAALSVTAHRWQAANMAQA